MTTPQYDRFRPHFLAEGALVALLLVPHALVRRRHVGRVGRLRGSWRRHEARPPADALEDLDEQDAVASGRKSG